MTSRTESSRGVQLPEQLVSLRLFGSFVRGDNDASSNLDVIAVLRPGSDLKTLPALNASIQTMFDQRASVSFYSSKRVRQMHAAGHLFAWHLFLQSRPMGWLPEPDAIAQLGKPVDYARAREDVESLTEILTTIPASLDRCPSNTTYEAGVMFVCLRNIALSASWYSKSGLDFTRYSPFNLEREVGLRFPISREGFASLVESRLSSQRGTARTAVDLGNLLSMHTQALSWSDSVTEFIAGNQT